MPQFLRVAAILAAGLAGVLFLAVHTATAAPDRLAAAQTGHGQPEKRIYDAQYRTAATWWDGNARSAWKERAT